MVHPYVTDPSCEVESPEGKQATRQSGPMKTRKLTFKKLLNRCSLRESEKSKRDQKRTSTTNKNEADWRVRIGGFFFFLFFLFDFLWFVFFFFFLGKKCLRSPYS